jgi:hypothetical protein
MCATFSNAAVSPRSRLTPFEDFVERQRWDYQFLNCLDGLREEGSIRTIREVLDPGG